MPINEQKIQVPILSKTVTADLSEEFSIPDYQPEIKRILRVAATVLPADSYVSAGSGEFSGRIEYAILYVGEDGKIYSTSLDGDYRFSLPVEIPGTVSADAGFFSDAVTEAEYVNARLLSPRKFSIKGKLSCRVRICGVGFLGSDAERIPDTELLLRDAETMESYVGIADALSVGDELSADVEKDARVVFSEGQVYVFEASAGSDLVNCRGEIALKMLLESGEEEKGLMTLQKKIPFSAEIPVEGAGVNCEAIVCGCVSNIQPIVEEGRIICDLSLTLVGRAFCNESVHLVTDAFSTVAESRAARETCELQRAEKSVSGSFSLDAEVSLSDAGIKKGQEVIDLCAVATVKEVKSENQKYLVSGVCKCHAVLYGGEEYSCSDFEIPFRYETSGEGGVSDFIGCASVISCKYRQDGKLTVNCEIGVSVFACEQTEVQNVSTLTLGAEYPTEAAACRVCYPVSGDTVWKLAKQYHKPVKSVYSENSLSDAPAADSTASLDGIRYLVI